MIIGIDASRAFSKDRTGIEEYSFQVIKNLANKLKDSQVVLYVRSSGESANALAVSPLRLPLGWKIKIIRWPFFWTQLGLSLEMLFHPVDVLFIPSHVVPIVHPARNASLYNLALLIQKLLKSIGVSTFYNEHSDAGGPQNTVVTIHGLEYEFFPEGYSFWERLYMRWSIKLSCKRAKKIIAVSENTKNDLVKLYQVPEEKIEVIYEGCDSDMSFRANPERAERVDGAVEESNPKNFIRSLDFARDDKYILFVGRLEARKNIAGILKAFEILKEKYKIPHKLILAGKFGYEKKIIKKYLSNMSHKPDIILPGFVSEDEKWKLLRGADVFLFPSFYEGFGLPILEAQASGVPVVTSNVSAMPEIAGAGALLVNPNDSEQVAKAVFSLISDRALKDDIIKKGCENIKRFSWEKCAEDIAKLINSLARDL